jgi:hypothetical protein
VLGSSEDKTFRCDVNSSVAGSDDTCHGGDSRTRPSRRARDPHNVIDRGSDALDQSRRQGVHHLPVLPRERRFEKDGRVLESLHAGEFSDGEKVVSR